MHNAHIDIDLNHCPLPYCRTVVVDPFVAHATEENYLMSVIQKMKIHRHSSEQPFLDTPLVFCTLESCYSDPLNADIVVNSYPGE